MLSFYRAPARLCDGYTRREVLRVGGLSLLGLSLPQLGRLRACAAADSPATPHRYNSCVFVFLFGGPSHIDLWDMKPEAPAEIRGEFKPVATKVPGIHLCEHLPMLAQQMDKFCLLRSMTHHMPVHGPACSEMYTGREYFGPPTTDQALPQDWPSLAALVARFAERHSGLPPSVVLPWYTQFDGQDKRIAGQTGGRMGEHHNAFLLQGDPSQPDFEVQGVNLPADVSVERLQRRGELHEAVERLASASRDGGGSDGSDAAGFQAGPTVRTGAQGAMSGLSSSAATRIFDNHYEQAISMLVRSRDTGAFDIAKEPQPTRERYGPTKFGQSLLLARRLVEAGVSLVTVNWDDETKFDKVSPFWDTHHLNFPKLKNHLCPIFDRSFSAFLEDLDARGLLETTLVAVCGEFGRTPRIGFITQNGMTEKTGRDHWPHAFTVLMAGGGVRGGQVYGATNATGGYVLDKPVSPADLAATILYHLGIDTTLEYDDGFQRMTQRLCEGRAITDLG